MLKLKTKAMARLPSVKLVKRRKRVFFFEAKKNKLIERNKTKHNEQLIMAFTNKYSESLYSSSISKMAKRVPQIVVMVSKGNLKMVFRVACSTFCKEGNLDIIF